MVRLNKIVRAFTREGARAIRFTPEMELKRALMNCLLWEDQFYEDGVAIADRIKALVPKVAPERVAQLAIEAREVMKLRHAPLLVIREMARNERHRTLVADTLAQVIQRPDEMTELLAIYWADALGPMQQRKRQPVSAQVKKGLARALTKFDAYQLAKWDRDGAVRIRDVLFLVHAKPKDADQAKVWKQLVDGELASPDTWEVSLSAGKNKRETFERLIAERKLGGLALLRNLRLMQNAQVPRESIAGAIEAMRTDRILPYRFITAARYAPDFEPELEAAMLKSIKDHVRLPGRTRLLIDVSGSMFATLSAQSEMTRAEAACGLAILAREICDEVEIFTFSNEVVKVPPRRGFALRDAIINSQPHGGTYLGKAVTEIDRKGDRLIVFTDEQSHDQVPEPKARGTMVNVASYQHGVGHGAWTRVNGFSEAVVAWIAASETALN
ncbi:MULTISPECIES: TROVE domain-containing protein [Bradyrhizobium]|uniref:TROVE domain-containing protein n=1 Tax=Bradyrhizobium yuanmingense TaxID=108015 RepID=A0A1C3VQF3_9BRAD|nr:MULTISPECIES: TROVE domain-containing protein [Bradyrhizobium]MCA1372536.1 TROVE domain-containing protein [Bradyrhizobium sp. IC4060]MCA1426033.1 TROVE domain-containing protein [Bradyrhizobium sp. NBAIM16]MCA1483626.1 TROVE domain-containing protein [Bradyrhizobium sp. IC4061]MCA1503394.1 TROVE domain-containing protein [Bradyrhizobium sp. NBAIM02]TWI28804.1 TROVE domain-containing protein [Bradyrhizobium yuanmingense]